MKRIPIVITKEEYETLMRFTKKKHHKLAFQLGYEAGLRIGEVLRLEQRHIDLKSKEIRIERSKGDKDRIAPVPKHFRQDYLKLLPLNIKERALEIAFKRIAAKAGLLERKPKLHFHSLRHGFATNCVLQGMNILEVKKLMGHENISTTNVYLEMDTRDAIKSYGEKF